MIEFADELVDGTKGAAVPLIPHDLGLSYEQVGLVAQGFGLSWALAGLVIVPAAVLLVPGRARSPDRVRA